MKTCYCGKNKSYADCCELLHKGIRKAETAEELMRSRYSAFAIGDVDYILRTYAERTRPVGEREQIQQWSKSVLWQGLEVISTHNGDSDQNTGTVEFTAYYTENGKDKCMHENSYFEKENSEWVYVSGEYPSPVQLPGRNEPCFCGSGKKFKKCCYKK